MAQSTSHLHSFSKMATTRLEYNAEDVANMVSAVQDWLTASEPQEIHEVVNILKHFQPMYVEFRKPAKVFAQTIALIMMAAGDFESEVDNFDQQWRQLIVYDECRPFRTMAEKLQALPTQKSVNEIQKAVAFLRGCVNNTVGKHKTFVYASFVCLSDVVPHVRSIFQHLVTPTQC